MFISFFITYVAVSLGKAICFGPERPFPRSSIVRVHIPSGLISDEGPLRSLKSFDFTFRIYPEFRYVYGDIRKRYDGKKYISLHFSNGIVSDANIHVTPRPSGFRIEKGSGHSNSTITLYGDFQDHQVWISYD